MILASRRLDKLKDLCSELGNAKAIEMDVADKNSVISCFSELEATGEKIDICVNNAGIAKLTPIFEEEQNDDFESLIQTNLMGVWYVTKAVANHMKNNNIHGSIINIASVNGEAFPYKEATGYAISKAAVIHMSKSLVTELSPYKIRINSISPDFRTLDSSQSWNRRTTKRVCKLNPSRLCCQPTRSGFCFNVFSSQ